ncbi:peptidylprolyl isomerase [Spirabiliibacterium pneumoniae]|uniref:peptidylprolyl isomerase n=1 Tax=Spirabiliibacterium pneumoniae TaxID=221400 RepID=UPI001F35776D|nr:peptidylprolyl isomerase [Spirabiliibacterium pneumoniae]
MNLTKMKHKLITLTALLGALLVAQPVMAAETVVATVDGYPILSGQVKQALGKRANTAANRAKALDDVIDDILVQKAIKDSGVVIRTSDVDRVLQGIADQNGLTWGQLLDALDYQGIDYHQFRNQIRHQLLMGQVRQRSIGKSIDVDRDQVLELGKKMQQEAKAKGNLHKATATEYRVSHILLKTNPILTDAKAKAQLTQLRSDILAKKISFEEAAKQNSKDYLSGYKGGDLGFAFPESYVGEFAKKVRSSKQGVISAPFKTEFGWHILKVTDTRKGDRTEQYYQQKAYENLINRQAQSAANNWVKALRKNADIKIMQH